MTTLETTDPAILALWTELRERVPVWSPENPEGVRIEVDAIKIEEVPGAAWANFTAATKTIRLEPGMALAPRPLYRLAHEAGHALDLEDSFDPGTYGGFGQLRDDLGLTDEDDAELEMIYYRFYSSSVADIERVRVEAIAVAFGLFYGGLPYGLRETAPTVFGAIMGWHFAHGGDEFGSREYYRKRDLMEWAPGHLRYMGPQARVRRLWRHQGWDRLTVYRRYLRFLPWPKRRIGGWDAAAEQRWNPSIGVENIWVKTGDYVVREVERPIWTSS